MIETGLARFGPQAQPEELSLSASQAYCRELATSHYENFPVVSWLLPRDLRQHFYNVYAYCRWADDLGDEVGDRHRSLDLLAWWREELDACCAGRARHPVMIALTETIRTFDIPREPFADLISAFEQDQHVREYETFDQLRDYCRRSADPVGRIILYLARRFTPERAAWSDHICTGLQLANFWQDVARDFAIGRIYLPREDRLQFAYSDAALEQRVSTPEFRELLRFEVARAREFLTAGLPLIREMPGRLQMDIDLFAQGGFAILRKIEAIQFRVWEQRPRVTKRDLVPMLLAALWRHSRRKMPF